MKSETYPRKVRFAAFEVDFSQREIRKHGMRLRLQHKPFKILELLLRRPGSLVTREELASHLWPDSHVSIDHSLNTAVNMLRQVLGDSSQGSRLIETRPGLGYSFTAPVQHVEAPLASAIPSAPSHDYLKGRYLLDKLTEEDTSKAVPYFESALLDNPRSALAFAGLADAWCEFARLSMAAPSLASRKAKDYAVLALSHDSALAEAHVAMARARILFDWDWKGARSEFIRAIEINPACAAAHRGYASLLQILGDNDGALTHIDAALALEPLSLPACIDQAWLFYTARDYEDAAAQCWKLLALEPRLWPAQLVLALAYHQLGMPDEALDESRNAVTCSSRHPIALALFGTLSPPHAPLILDELHQQSARRYVPPSAFTLLHLALQANPSALACLNLALDQRDPNLLWLHRSPLLEALIESSPRASALLTPFRKAASTT